VTCGAICTCSHTVARRSRCEVVFIISVLVLTPLPGAPDPAHAIRVTGNEPQRSGILGDKQTTHFTIKEIHRIPSRFYCSLERRILAKRLACHHPRSPCAQFPLLAFGGPLQPLRACSDTVQLCYDLRTLVQVALRPMLNMHSPPPICLLPSLPLSVRFSLQHAPHILPGGPLGIFSRSACATLPRSLATHWHHC
jgi:hypothetical protein